MDQTLTVKAVLDYVENRVAEDFPLRDIVGATGFSASHLRVLFRQCTGQSPGRYIKNRRLNHAAFELAQTSRSVSDIAMTFCFGSHDAFTRALRREFHQTPSESRSSKPPVSGKLIVPGVYGPSV